MSQSLFLLPGDGIGTEIMAEVEKLIARINETGATDFDTENGLVGGCAYDAHGVAISEEDMEKALAADAVIFGAVGGPKWDGVPYEVRPEAGLLRLRKDHGAVRQSAAGHLLSGAGRCLLAEARSGRGARHPDRARTDRRRLFRRAQGDHRSRQRPEARRSTRRSTRPTRSSASAGVAFDLARTRAQQGLLDGKAQRHEIGRALGRGGRRHPQGEISRRRT